MKAKQSYPVSELRSPFTAPRHIFTALRITACVLFSAAAYSWRCCRAGMSRRGGAVRRHPWLVMPTDDIGDCRERGACNFHPAFPRVIMAP